MPATSIRNLRWASRNCISFLLLWVLCVSCAAAAGRAALQERLLLVDINQQQLNQTVMLLEVRNGALLVSSADLQRWRLLLPATIEGIDYQGERYFPLDAIPDVSHVYDAAHLTLTIQVRPESFTATTRSIPSSTIPLPLAPTPGGFINYDLFISQASGTSARSALFELGGFNRMGVGTHNVLANNSGERTRVTRLESTWTTDLPQRRQALHVGDILSVPGTWGRSVRFGGIQFGSNFGTQPGLVTSPQQSIAGEAVLPSTVEVMINNALVSSQQVPPGPFTLSHLPLVTGAGTIQLVVRDMFGREQVVTRSFYASQSLLREGLESYSCELGRVRENFGITSNDYGAWLGSATYRRGVNDLLTAEVHAEVMREQATIGAGTDWLLPRVGTISSYLAGSHHKDGNGSLLLLGVERLAHPWSLGARTQWTSSGFVQSGTVVLQPPPLQISSANLSYADAGGGTLGFSYVAQLNRGLSAARFVTMNYSVAVGTYSALSFSVLRTLSVENSTRLFTLFSTPMGTSTSMNLNAQSVRGASGDNNHVLAATLQRNLPSGEGSGYRLQARSDGDLEASGSWQNNIGTYTLDAAHDQGIDALRLNATGGIALLGGDVFLSRRIEQSFAVVSITDYPNVHVFADNQPAGITGAEGSALLPRLRPYDINSISVDQRDLPLDAEVGSLKLDAIPYYRSGIEISFPIRHANAATFTIHLENGKVLPVGATVQMVGKDETYPVGYEGEVYVSGLSPISRLRATWRNKQCEFEVGYPVSDDPLPDLGTFICTGVQP